MTVFVVIYLLCCLYQLKGNSSICTHHSLFTGHEEYYCICKKEVKSFLELHNELREVMSLGFDRKNIWNKKIRYLWFGCIQFNPF